MEDWLLGFCFALVISAITTPAGVSGAVFSASRPGERAGGPKPVGNPYEPPLERAGDPWRAGSLRPRRSARWSPTRLLVLGAMPGAVIGAVIRVEVLSGPDVFLVVVGCVLVPLGVLLLTRRPEGPASPRPSDQRRAARRTLARGRVVGGIYGIGGGSILAPGRSYPWVSQFAWLPRRRWPRPS